MSLKMLLQKLGKGYAERSVRRWLAELVKEGLVEKTGKKRATQYKVLQHDLFVFSYLRTCALYDTTVKTVGFDEIRVRYRQQRRALIRDIIVNNIRGKAVQKYISSQVARLVKKPDRDAFVADLMEDLQEIDESRIAGLGVTLDQLNRWLTAQKET